MGVLKHPRNSSKSCKHHSHIRQSSEAGGWKRCFLWWAMLQIWHHWIFRPPPPVLLQRLHDNVMLQSNCRIHTLRALKQMSDHVFTEKQSLKLLKHAFSMLLDASGHYLNMGLIVNYVLFVGKKSLEWKVDFQCLGSAVSVFRPRRGCSIICCQRQWRLTRNSQQPERSKRSNMTANFDYWLDFIWIRTKDMICVYVYVYICMYININVCFKLKDW